MRSSALHAEHCAATRCTAHCAATSQVFLVVVDVVFVYFTIYDVVRNQCVIAAHSAQRAPLSVAVSYDARTTRTCRTDLRHPPGVTTPDARVPCHSNFVFSPSATSPSAPPSSAKGHAPIGPRA